MSTMKYGYFVSFTHEDEDGVHFGNMEIDTNALVTDMDAIALFEGYITNNMKLKNVVVLNYVFLKKL